MQQQSFENVCEPSDAIDRCAFYPFPNFGKKMAFLKR